MRTPALPTGSLTRMFGDMAEQTIHPEGHLPSDQKFSVLFSG